jgi:hypothetical protein
MPRAKHVGERPPRYAFILNPHDSLRLSRCPKCNKLTYPRKFALFIHIDGWGPFVLGKTCRYCNKCELIMAHQDEVETLLTGAFEHVDPNVVGNKYLVLGTLDMKAYRAQMKGRLMGLDETLKQVADFKKVYDLGYDPGGWGPVGEERPLKYGRTP